MEKKLQKTSYILQFINGTRFMASSSSILVNNLSEGIHRNECKLEHDDKKCEAYEIKYRYCECFLEYKNFKDDLLEYKSLCCNKKLSTEVCRKINRTIFNTYKFYNYDTNKFILLLRQGVYPQ